MYRYASAFFLCYLKNKEERSRERGLHTELDKLIEKYRTLEIN